MAWSTREVAELSKGAQVTQETVLATIVEVYHQTRRDALTRAAVIAKELLSQRSEVRSEGTAGEGRDHR